MQAQDQSGLFVSFVALAIVAILLFLYIYQCALIVNSQYSISKLKQTQAALLRERAQLQLDVHNLASYERIEKIAKIKWGMGQPLGRVVIDYSQPLAGSSCNIMLAQKP